MKKYQLFDKKKEEEKETMETQELVQQEKDFTAQKQLETVILNGIHFSGDIKGGHDIYLNGEFEGKIELSALLYVGQTGKLRGEIKAENIIIEGDVEGTLEAEEKLEVRDGGKCNGDILAPSVLISDKAFFQGQVTMARDKKDGSPKKAAKDEKSTSFKKNEDAVKQEITVVDTDETVKSEKVKEDRGKAEKVKNESEKD
jgi:cytoskeletal protein CcmA (bactofilin family)